MINKSELPFYKLSFSNLFAQFAEQMALAAAPIIAVLFLEADAKDTAWLQTSQTLPFLLFSIPLGVLADRIARRNIMIGAEMVRAASCAIIIFLLFTDRLNFYALAILGFAGAIGTVGYNVASPGYVPTIIDKTELLKANSWLELARSLAYSLGPALGGSLVAQTGASPVYVLATIFSSLALILMLSLPTDNLDKPIKRTSIIRGLCDGAGFIYGHKLLWHVFMTALFFNIASFIMQGVFVAYAVQDLDMNATSIGFALGCAGFGMVAGILTLKIIQHRFSFGLLIIIGPLSATLAMAIILLTFLFPYFVLTYFAYFLFGFGPVIWSIMTTSLRQVVTPDQFLGRVSALLATATYGARPLASAIAALTAGWFGVKICLLLSFAGFIIQLAIISFSPVAKIKSLSDAR